MNSFKQKLTIITVALFLTGGLITFQTTNAACVNDPGNNNGDCVSDQYGNDFCEESWAWHDCVQGTEVEDPEDTEEK